MIYNCLLILLIINFSASIDPPRITNNANFTFTYNEQILNDRHHVYVFPRYGAQNTSRVVITCEHCTDNNPLMVAAQQHNEIVSWQLPLIVASDSGQTKYFNTGRTLCPSRIANFYNYYGIGTVNDYEGPIITISTAASYNITYTLRVDLKDALIEQNILYNTTISPSEPIYYFYNFPSNNTDENDSVLLEVNSDEICMKFSVQNASCPVYDLLHDITFKGYWATVNKKGGITISRQKFPKGFFVVFVAMGDDSDCDGTIGTPLKNRTKHLNFIIKPSISYKHYVKAVAVTLGCIVLAYCILVSTFILWSAKDTKPRCMNYVDENDCQIATTPSSINYPQFNDDESIDETEYDTITERDIDVEMIFSKPILYLSDLSRKDPRILRKKSNFYLWHVLTVALFYGLPVVQLVITYQNVLNNTGNQDLCYYNFLCAHPFGFISDFNHLFSNIGYVVFGILFILLVYRRAQLHRDDMFEKHFGIPQHYGLYYAIGTALIMEGILSGSYHICPNHSNFQFDSSFMYVIAVLCVVKLYQSRHPDINATAYSTFGVLAIAILLGMIGVLEANLIFWISFTILHIITCLIMTPQIYYFGYWKLDSGIFKRVWQVYFHDLCASPTTVLRPLYKSRMVLIIIGNLCNWGLAVLGINNHDKDFATYLLAVFMSNTMLYFFYYIFMKLLLKERIKLQPLTYLIISVFCAVAAIYFFYHKSISWALTPAQSRWYNQECKLLKFYDYHDIWHFLSAIGMFFSFMMLLTLDDDLSHTPRTKIAVF